MNMGNVILFAGDPHGRFDPAVRAAHAVKAAAIVFLGDFDLTRPLHEALASLPGTTAAWWIPGNHDTDQIDHHDHLFGSQLADRNLHGRVTEIAGLRVAGLGGVYRAEVWHPADGDGQPRHHTAQGFMRTVAPGRRFRGGLPLKHRSTIFWQDYERLWDERADILVTHEAPSCHRHGFAEIDQLALAMGVSLIVHGHHHQRYTGSVGGGIRVEGVGLAGVIDGNGRDIVAGLSRSVRRPKGG